VEHILELPHFTIPGVRWAAQALAADARTTLDPRALEASRTEITRLVAVATARGAVALTLLLRLALAKLEARAHHPAARAHLAALAADAARLGFVRIARKARALRP
jgi:hypothetical protein